MLTPVFSATDRLCEHFARPISAIVHTVAFARLLWAPIQLACLKSSMSLELFGGSRDAFDAEAGNLDKNALSRSNTGFGDT